MKAWNGLLLPVLLVFALPGVPFAQSASDPVIGTWVLNISRSTFKPGPAPQSETRTFEATPDGVIHMLVRRVVADGTNMTETSKFKLDGKPYAVAGTPNVDVLEMTRVNDRVLHTNLMHNGKVVGHINYTVSKNDKALTATITLLYASGQPMHGVWIYERQ
jgi:hypothetical protein